MHQEDDTPGPAGGDRAKRTAQTKAGRELKIETNYRPKRAIAADAKHLAILADQSATLVPL